MLFFLLFINVSIPLFALEISLESAKENFQNYSTLQIKDSTQFLCQETKNDLDVVTEIACAFTKQPSRKFKTLQNDYFTVTSNIKNNTFFLVITPYQKMKLFPIIFNLSKDEVVFQGNVQLSQHWMIIGYKDKLPYIKEDAKSEICINFPFLLSKDKLPYVGGLDLKGNPVYIKKVHDVSEYLKIKKLYQEKKYDLCLDAINDVMRDYPQSLFNAELLFYKIRVFAQLGDNDNVVESSKIYLREYSSDENVPEVLSLIAKSYSMIGLNIDADYFFDRLFMEHEDSEYSNWGYIYKGEMFEASGDAPKALNFYEKALNETKDIEIAATAAYKLAKYKTANTDKKDASKYVMKIANAKPEFFMNELKNSLEMMYSFAEEEDYLTAATIAKCILDETKKDDDEYEQLLKERAIWLSKSDNKIEALKVLNEYLDTFKEGNFENEITVAKDSLFFDTADLNVTSRLEAYNELISTYPNDTIGDRAIYEKAKLLLENEKYGDILGFKDSLQALDNEKYKDTTEIVKNAAIGVMKLSLKEKECMQVLTISSEYNITLSNEWDDEIYICAMKGGDYLLSKKIANRNLKSQDLELRKKWLYRYIKVDFTTGNYSDVVEASKELILLIQDNLSSENNNEYRDVYRFLFDTYQRLENTNAMIDTIADVQKVFGEDYKDIERYVAVMTIGSQNKDDAMVIKYAVEVMKIQNSSSSYTQSPFVEFTLYQSYMNKEDYSKALDVIKSLDTVDLSKAQRSRQKYLLGTTYSKLSKNEEAKKAYQDAIDADEASAWAKLAKSAKDI